MGMFDYITCEMPLPDGYGTGFVARFQTKAFECELVVHTIRADGQLMEQYITDTEIVPMSERPYPGDGPMSIIGSMRVNVAEKPSTRTGKFTFYTHDRDVTPDWREYVAELDKGKVISIIPRPTNNERWVDDDIDDLRD